MNPKRTVTGLAVIATASLAIPLGSTANAAETHPTPATAGPMATAFNTAAHTGTARTKNSSRIDCDDSGENFGDYLGGYAAAEGGGSPTMSIAQAAMAGAMAGAVGGAMAAFANNAFEGANATGEQSAPSQSDSPTAFD